MQPTLYVGNSLDILPSLPDNSVDSVVCDPPYELGFMGKGWDASGIAYSVELWTECLRVLKPGGHLLAFGGTRTYHRMAVAIEDAGFEIRDSIHWTYGSGFPKSLNISKAIDKAAGAERPIVEKRRTKGGGTESLNRKNAEDHEYRPDGYQKGENVLDVTAAATEAAAQWEGWGTSLKPSHEPIVVARKPLDGTVVANTLAHGVGGLNIDGCRVKGGPSSGGSTSGSTALGQGSGWNAHENKATVVDRELASGRWPANTILGHTADCVQVGESSDTFGGGAKATSGFVDGYENDGFVGTTVTVPVWECAGGCPVRSINDQSGQVKGGTWNRTKGARPFGNDGKLTEHETTGKDSSVGGAARYFQNVEWNPATDDLGSLVYVTKANKKERPVVNGVSHATVKPLALMTYLVRLVTPVGGVVLDPFAGSGTTMEAAVMEGMTPVGIELTPEHVPLIEARMERCGVELAIL